MNSQSVIIALFVCMLEISNATPMDWLHSGHSMCGSALQMALWHWSSGSHLLDQTSSLEVTFSVPRESQEPRHEPCPSAHVFFLPHISIAFDSCDCHNPQQFLHVPSRLQKFPQQLSANLLFQVSSAHPHTLVMQSSPSHQQLQCSSPPLCLALSTHPINVLSFSLFPIHSWNLDAPICFPF